MKAEIDENSSAYHGKYKDSQGMETLAIYFPSEVYGDTTKKVMMEELPKTESYKHFAINNTNFSRDKKVN